MTVNQVVADYAEWEQRLYHPLFLSETVDLLEVGLFVLDRDQQVRLWNRWMKLKSGISTLEAYGRRITDIFPQIAGTRLQNTIQTVTENGMSSFLSRAFHPNPLPLKDEKKGFEVEQNITVRRMLMADGEFCCVVQVTDITENVRREASLREQSEKLKRLSGEHLKVSKTLESILLNIPEAVVTIDEQGTIQTVNKATCAIFGYEPEDLIGGNVNVLMPEPYRSEHDKYLDWYMTTGEARIIGSNREVMGRRRDGSTFPADLSISEAVVGDKRVFTGIVRDITERKLAERKLKEANEKLTSLALYDPLTGLANRRLLLDHLQQFLARASRRGEGFSLMFIDLDGFKQVNDTLGHDAGDRVLKEFATRLKEIVRRGDVCARLGGDEFIVMVEKIDAVDTASEVAEKIIEQARRPIQVDASEVNISASVGIAFQGKDGSTAEDLLRAGDAAMYTAKQRGKNAYAFANS